MTGNAARLHELNLYRRYFDLVAAGTKSIEVRVRYPHLTDLRAGDVIRFRVKGTEETVDAARRSPVGNALAQLSSFRAN